MINLPNPEKAATAGRRGKTRLLSRADKRTLIMGIVNLTPDSFSGDGFYRLKSAYDADLVEAAVNRALEMEADGADIIDVGGESTRPGSAGVSAEEEIARVIPVIRALKKRSRVPVSIDTSKSEVAGRALEEGAEIVNDVTALKGDGEMAALIARRRVPVVLMHMKGTPRTMQVSPRYRSLISDIKASLGESIGIARTAGVRDENIIVDPGIGFGKTTEHNLTIIRNLREFKSMGYPVLIGLSRKSFIGKVLGLPVEERVFGTAAGVAVAVINGADIVRVHDVKQMAQVIRMTEALMGKK